MKLKQLNKEERPREKAMEKGIGVLINRELIAVLLRTGTSAMSVLEVADEVLGSYEHLGDMGKSSIQELMEISGIKEAKAITLLAGFELGRRIALDEVKNTSSISHPQDLVGWLNQQIGYEKQEQFIVVFLNQKNQIMKYQVMFTGTLTSASVHPREIFKAAMRLGCAKILCAHNHPSGDCTPSQADIDLTNSIMECGRMASIPLVDHLIVGRNSFTSFRQKRLID